MQDKNDGYDRLRKNERAIKIATYGNHVVRLIEEEQKLLDDLIQIEIQSELYQKDINELQASPWNYSKFDIINIANRRATVRAGKKLAVLRYEKKMQLIQKAYCDSELLLDKSRITFKKINLAQTAIDEIDRMDGLEFELFIADVFKLKGYTIETTPVSGDFGVDLILYKNGIKSALQAKRYSENVGVSAIQEVVSGSAYYKCDNSIVLTNRFFTAAAEELGTKLGVFLINRYKLIEMIKSLNENM